MNNFRQIGFVGQLWTGHHVEDVLNRFEMFVVLNRHIGVVWDSCQVSIIVNTSDTYLDRLEKMGM